MGCLCVSLSVSVSHHFNFVFLMTSKGFLMVLEATEAFMSFHDLPETFMSFCKLPWVKWIINRTQNTKLTTNYAQRSANNWSCLFVFFHMTSNNIQNNKLVHSRQISWYW